MTVFICTPENMHPYECDGPGHCIHCDRHPSATHNPDACPLCADDAPADVDVATLEDWELSR